jgi:hypothetical protein
MPSRKQRRSSKTRRMRGGMSPLNDMSMSLSRQNSLSQGSDYLRMHKGQYGGGPAAYPASFSSTLPASMVASARTGPLDSAIGAIQGMQDGGRRRRRRGGGSCKMMRGGRRTMKKRNKRSNKSRKHRGGSRGFMGAPLTANAMLLPPGAERQAALSHEWGLAKDPSSFSPKP